MNDTRQPAPPDRRCYHCVHMNAGWDYYEGFEFGCVKDKWCRSDIKEPADFARIFAMAETCDGFSERKPSGGGGA